MKRIALLVSFAIACLTAGCKSTPEKHYPLHAVVISADAPRGLIVMEHGEIPGLMPAMTMQYSVADPKQTENLGRGTKSRRTLSSAKAKAIWRGSLC